MTPARLLLSAQRLAWTGTACGVLGAVLLSIRAVLGGGGGAASVPLLVAACVCFGYAVACYGLAHARRIGAFLVRSPVRRRGPGDDEQAVWYCERCNAVFTTGTLGCPALAIGARIARVLCDCPERPRLAPGRSG